MKYFILMVSAFSLLAGCAGFRPIPVNPDLLTNEDEQRLLRRAQEEQDTIDAGGRLYQDTDVVNYLNRIVGRLQKKSTSSDMSFRTKVIRDPNLNAFAFPDGTIYIYTGILARMENEAQLAALLAHEMVHCINRHSLKALAIIRQTAAGGAERADLARLPGLSGPGASSGYTRELEIEADQIGLDLVIKANYDPWETVSLFNLLKEEIEFEGIEEPYFFRTHPNVQQRIENITKWLQEKSRQNQPENKNTERFLSRMSRLMLDNAVLDLRRGRFVVARRTVENYLDVKPDNARAYFLLGEIFRQRGRDDDAASAIGYYEKAISLNPTFAEPHKAIGLIHYKAGEKGLAQKFFQSCLVLSPDSADKAYLEKYLKLCSTKEKG